MKALKAEIDMFHSLGRLIEVCGTKSFSEVLESFLAEQCGVSEFSVLLFQSDKVPVPLFSSVTKYDEGLKRYCNGLYLLDPFYIAYDRDGFTGFAKWGDIISKGYEGSIGPYLKYMGDWGDLEEAGYIFEVSDDASLHFSFARKEDAQKFGEQSLGFLENFYAFLSPLVKRHWREIDVNFNHVEEQRLELHATIKKILTSFGSSVLTEREQEIVQCMLQGHSTKSMAGLLGISPGTVNVHRSNIYEKLDISSNSELFSLFLDALMSMGVSGDEDILAGYMSY